MPKESSVAPKERVNIVYKPATGNAQAEIELPLKLMVLGDFTSQADSTPLEERKAIRVDKDSFNDVMSKHDLHLTLNVPDKLSGAEGDLPVNLTFNTLKDFEPQAIAGKVPELAKLLELRDALTALKGPLANVPGFRKKIEELLKDEAQRDRIIKELGLGGAEGSSSGA
jgi:type VI secretion system protein ImpB